MEQEARATSHEAEPDTGRRGQGTASGSEAAEALNRQRFELLRCALYHDASARQIQRLNRGLTFLNILLSSAAIAAFGTVHPRWGQYIAAVVAAISAAQLVWDFTGRAVQHQDLRRRFYDLLADLEAGEGVETLNSRMTRIYADEPPMNDRRNRRAHNQAGDSVYGPGKFERA